MADIPGIIEGAHRGLGLGLSFLQHIERVKVIIYVIDMTQDDPLYTLELLKSELKQYKESLLQRPYIIAANKTDLVDGTELKDKMSVFKSLKVIPISSLNGDNINSLLDTLKGLME
jgi:GTP-binding protein